MLFIKMFYKFLIYNTCSLMFIYTSDYILCRIYNDKARWFQLHFFINMIISYYTIGDTLSIIQNPCHTQYSVTNYEGGALSLSLHVYHTLFFNLSSTDIYHHITSVLFAIPINIIYDKRTNSMFYFFLTGIPGGLDYLCLTLVKNNKMNYITQKNFSSKQNTFIRMPGGIICCYLIFYSMRFLHGYAEHISAIMLLIIIFLNVTIFGKMSIENYAVRKYERDNPKYTQFQQLAVIEYATNKYLKKLK